MNATVRRLFSVAPLLLAVISACAGEPDGTNLFPRESGRYGLMLIAHGNGSSADRWPSKLIQTIRASGRDLGGWDVYACDWEEEAARVLTASREGYQIGRAIARSLIDDGDGYRVIHLVGHSMGAHLVQGIIDEYRALGGHAYLHATFLDPFVFRGLVGFGYGVRRFGAGADFAENYIVRPDPIVGTNRYLRHTFNTDVSAVVPARIREERRGPHWWVVEYYRQSVNLKRPGFDRSPLAAGLSGIPEDLDAHFASLRHMFRAGSREVIGD